MRNLILIFSIVFVASKIQATIINVPADIDSIQGGINIASYGDTVLVQSGTYIECINYNGKNIVIGSLFLTTDDTSYISQTIISADTSIHGPYRGSVVTLENGEDSTAVLTGFTITNGNSWYGGGIHISNSHPTISFMQIANNLSAGERNGGFGGGIYCLDSSPYLINVEIVNNCSAYGGGIYCDSSNPILTNVKIRKNYSGTNGGGIYCLKSNPVLTNLEIINNSSGLGGGIFCDSSALSLKSVIIKGNNADGYSQPGELTPGNGGGICLINSSNSMFNNVQILENDCSDFGGGIYCNNSIQKLFDVTISDNTAMYGGGLSSSQGHYWYADSSYIFLSNVSITNNSAFKHTNWSGVGGGIHIDVHTRLFFDSDNLCNIFNNYADSIGYDLFSDADTIISVIVDTFTVMQPDSTHAFPLNKFTFDILNTSVTDIVRKSEAPIKFYLKQNYPNPFNPKTTIEYQLSKPSYIDLSIYNLLGQKVSILTLEKQSAGNYKVEWNASGFASGLYFYRLETGAGFVQSRKLILLK